jgi:hypothetical protein
MSKEIVDEPFEAATEEVERAHREVVESLKSRVAKAKSDALQKIKT